MRSFVFFALMCIDGVKLFAFIHLKFPDKQDALGSIKKFVAPV